MVDGGADTKSPSREKMHVPGRGTVGREGRLTVSMKCCRHS